ncbi:formin 2, putative [Plasmodium berghei]|uniref:Formin 2, putative n=2 Tax=Plasmodium berghei TaxID=5821 RepID=A0A509AUT2_PLABA|nr:formin 2, putative [Plasmodium berghei ANKA]CXJ21044.1 formin 2, putative [Plasmodium berghei]SCM26571.1 formin 2, putative [Plasmodium berghei]SCN28525.1 formin 2, putative [Plasmodium berghei]SCO62715.1 formin 2, putative [Plasmodium berghei]SCO64276.1 formin 2, putative [Plasmodium berghei]|eukprot:XP_034424171.1 formin 2, putative [Plasmodium berghei ANKA]
MKSGFEINKNKEEINKINETQKEKKNKLKTNGGMSTDQVDNDQKDYKEMGYEKVNYLKSGYKNDEYENYELNKREPDEGVLSSINSKIAGVYPLWKIEEIKENNEKGIPYNKVYSNNIQYSETVGNEYIILDNFVKDERKKKKKSKEHNEKKHTTQNKKVKQIKIEQNIRNKYNQISGLNTTNYLLIPDEIRHKYTKTYLFQISKRLLVMKKPWRLPKNVELQINNVYHLSNYIKVLERVSNEYLNDPPINCYYKGLELYNKNVFANIDYLLKKVDIKKYSKNIKNKNLIKINECYYDLSTFGKSPNSMLYQSYIIWDIHGNCLSLEQEYDHFFDSQIMDYNFGEKDYPNLKYISSICSSILFWLNLNQKDNFSIINYHKNCSFTLLIFSCVMLALDNSLTFHEIQETLYKSSKMGSSTDNDTETDIGSDFENDMNKIKELGINEKYCTESNYLLKEYEYLPNYENFNNKVNILNKNFDDIEYNEGICKVSSEKSDLLHYDDNYNHICDQNKYNNKLYNRNKNEDKNIFNNVAESRKYSNFSMSNSINEIRYTRNIYTNEKGGIKNTYNDNSKENISPFKKKFQYHTLNLVSKDNIIYNDTELDKTKKKKIKKNISNSWGFGSPNIDTHKNKSKIKDHHFWIPFDYWKASHKRYFFYMYELIKNKNKQTKNIPYKLKSIIFTDYVLCSLSVEVYEVIYKDNKYFSFNDLSNTQLNIDNSADGKQIYSDKKFSDIIHTSTDDECIHDETKEKIKNKSKRKIEKKKKKKKTPCCDCKFGFANRSSVSSCNQDDDKTETNDINEQETVNNENKNIKYKKMYDLNIPYINEKESSDLSFFNNRHHKINYQKVVNVDKKKKHSIYIGNKGFQKDIINNNNLKQDKNSIWNVEKAKSTSNIELLCSSCNLPKSSKFNINKRKVKSLNNLSKNYEMFDNIILENDEKENYLLCNNNSICNCSIDSHNYNKNNDSFLFEENSKTCSLVNADSVTMFESNSFIKLSSPGNKENNSFKKKQKESTKISGEEDNNLNFVTNIEIREYNILEENKCHCRDIKKDKIYNTIKKKTKNEFFNNNEIDEKLLGSCTRPGYEYILKCNHLNYNFISSYEKNKKKYVTIDFTHDAEGNEKEHIICGDILILIGHKNADKYHKGFSTSYSFHTGFLKGSTSEIIHIRKEDMDINSNYENYIPDSSKLSVILEPTTNNDNINTYKKILVDNNRVEDLKELQKHEENNIFMDTEINNLSFNEDKKECDIINIESGNNSDRQTNKKEILTNNLKAIAPSNADKNRTSLDNIEKQKQTSILDEEKKNRRSIFQLINKQTKSGNIENEENQKREGEINSKNDFFKKFSDSCPEDVNQKIGETKEIKENSCINVSSNNKRMELNSRVNYNIHSSFSEKETKSKYSTSNITQLLSSLFGFKNRDDKFSLLKKQNAGSLLSSKKTFSNLISLNDFLQRQYEIISKPSESLSNFVLSHVKKVNMPLVQYLKEITYLSNLEIFLSLKICNNDIYKALKFIEATWGLDTVKGDGNRKNNRIILNTNSSNTTINSSKHDTPILNDLTKCHEEKIKDTILEESNNKFLSISDKIPNISQNIKLTDTNKINLETFDKLNKDESINNQNIEPLWNKNNNVFSNEENNNNNDKNNLKCQLNNTNKIQDEENETLQTECLTKQSKGIIKDYANIYENKIQQKRDSNSYYVNKKCLKNKDAPKLVTHESGIKISKFEIDKVEYEKVDSVELVKEEKKKTEYIENENENSSSISSSINTNGILLKEENNINDNISNNILKKLGESNFFYAKLPSGDLVKLKIQKPHNLDVHDNAPLLLIESVNLSEKSINVLDVLINENKNNNDDDIKSNTIISDHRINNMEKTYNEINKKTEIVESINSIETEDGSTLYKIYNSTDFISSISGTNFREKEFSTQKSEDSLYENSIEKQVDEKKTEVDEKKTKVEEKKIDEKKTEIEVKNMMEKRAATSGPSTKAISAKTIIKKSTQKKPPPPLPKSLAKAGSPKEAIEPQPDEISTKNCSKITNVSKKNGKKAPNLPEFLLNKMSNGKSKGVLKKCPPGLCLKKAEKLEEKRPLGIKLHWQLLPTHKIEGTVFNEIKTQEVKYNLIDTKTVHKLFSRIKQEKKVVKKSVEYKKKSNEEKLITVLDRTRAQNIGILLRFPISTQEIVNKINVFDLENINIEFLQKVLHIFPTKEESDGILEKLKGEGVNEESFRDVERKLIPFIHSNKFQCKIEICLFSLKYDKIINDINKDLDTYDKAIKEARSSTRLRSLLKAVLKWGNYVNYGINDNQDLVALGFTLSSVLKLTEFKSSLDSSITSLHYITVSLCISLPNLNMNHLENDLHSVLLASKMSSESVDIMFALLDKEINYIKSQLNCNFEEKFMEKMKAALHDSETKYIKSMEKYQQIKKEVYELGKYLGEDIPKTGNLENIFIILSSIVNNFTKCYKEISANTKKFAIMLNDESLLNEYYNVFNKNKSRYSNNLKNSNTANKNSINETNKQKSVINPKGQIKIKINNTKPSAKNNNAKVSMFQLKNMLFRDIQNTALIKKNANASSLKKQNDKSIDEHHNKKGMHTKCAENLKDANNTESIKKETKDSLSKNDENNAKENSQETSYVEVLPISNDIPTVANGPNDNNREDDSKNDIVATSHILSEPLRADHLINDGDIKEKKSK